MIITKLNDLNGYWLSEIYDVKNIVNTHTFTRENIRYITNEIKINFGRKRAGKCINWITILLLNDETKAIKILKRQDVFRLSNRKENTHIIVNILEELIKNEKELGLSPNSLTYLKSKLSFSKIIDEYFFIETNIVLNMKKMNECFVTNLLFLSDYIFYEIDFSPLEERKIKKYDMSPEEIVESTSYLIFIYYKNFGFSNKDNLCVYRDNILNNEKYISIIKDAFTIKSIKEKEMFIDNYNYQCNFSENTLLIESKDISLEKSIRYGFIYTDVQKINTISSRFREKENEVYSISSFIKDELKESNEIIKLLEEPISRYAIFFHKIDYLIDFFKEESLYYEEMVELIINENENIIDSSQLVAYKISENLTLWDTIIIKRVLRFYTGAFYKKIKEVENNNRSLALRSWLPVLTRNSLLELLGMYVGVQKANEFIRIYTWTTNSKNIFDLQYTPIVKINQMYYLCSNLLINSSTLRNIIIKEKLKRPIETGNNDVSSNIVYKALSEKFEFVSLEVDFKYSKFHGDFDVLMYSNGIVYIFECKNIIHPAGFHELRSTFDNIKKGFKQLDKGRNAFSDKSFIEYINNKLDWNIRDENLKIVTCLVLSNRMFSGYNEKKNHVRSVYELSNFISSGKVEMENNTLSLWSSDVLTNNDLYLYLEKDRLHSLIFESMIPRYNYIKLMTKKIVTREYGLDVESSLKKITKEFPLCNIKGQP